jgi:hypothetical protein
MERRHRQAASLAKNAGRREALPAPGGESRATPAPAESLLVRSSTWKEQAMKKTLTALAVLGFAGAAVAQTAPSTPPPPSSTKAPPPMTDQEKAQTRIEGAGFTGVKDLKRNADGTWTGRAVKGGVEVAVSVDGAGHVVTH